MTSKQLGNLAEEKAKLYLIKDGYTIVIQNFYSRHGEIDIIAKNDEYIVFVEVKYRKNSSFASPIENVTPAKIRRIIKTAQYYIYKNRLENNNFRFDVIEVFGDNFETTHIPNAFWG